MSSQPVVVWPFSITALNDSIYGFIPPVPDPATVDVPNGDYVNTPLDLDLGGYGYPPFPTSGLQAALNSLYQALHPGVDTPFVVTISNEGYVSITLQAGFGAVTVDVSAGAFDWSIVGFDVTTDLVFPAAVATTLTSEFPAKFLFAPGWEAEWDSSDTEHFAKSSDITYSGRPIRRVHGSYYRRKVIWQAVHSAYVMNERASDPVYTATAGLHAPITTQCSPNTYENLIRYLNSTDSTTYPYLPIVHLVSDWASVDVFTAVKGPYNIILGDDESLTLVEDMSSEHYQIALNLTRTWTAPL